jgi:transmembrane sensor
MEQEKEPNRYEELADKWLKGTITPEEALEYANWYNQDDGQPVEVPVSFVQSREAHEARILRHVENRITPKVTVYRPFFRVAAAAAVLLLMAGGLWLYESRKPEVGSRESASAMPRKDVLPGHNGAVLTLSNGQKIVLDSAGNGQLAKDANVAVIKKDGEIIYRGKTDEIVYNTISTAKGRQWQLTLPDGTKVWLNAASSIRYPLSFTGSERMVEITGEAYFEVVHNAKMPFRVHINTPSGDGGIIEDIGTHFNVNAYSDEANIKTTLLEGSVKVSTGHHSSLVNPNSSLTLLPGQQAQVNAKTQSVKLVKDADVMQAVAWKNGVFAFTDANLPAVMRQLARWYNVEVEYAGAIPTGEFNGKIGKNLTLAQVLKGLTSTRVNFRIENSNKIIILP